jgi:hypothetical protein
MRLIKAPGGAWFLNFLLILLGSKGDLSLVKYFIVLIKLHFSFGWGQAQGVHWFHLDGLPLRVKSKVIKKFAIIF